MSWPRLRTHLVCWIMLGCVLAGCGETLQPERLAALVARAEGGDKEATHELCYRNIYGVGIPRDYPSALRWCERGAAAGVSDSQTLLAEIQYQGWGVPVDYRRALELYLAAARQEHSHAQYMVFVMYNRGEAGTLEEAEARKWLRRAADGGHESAQRALRDLRD